MAEAERIVRAVYEVLAERDLEALGALVADDVLLRADPRIVPAGSEYRGLDGVRAWLEEIGQLERHVEFHPRSFEARDGAVLVEGAVAAEGSPGGGFAMASASIWHVRDARVIEVETFGDLREAREAFEAQAPRGALGR